MTKKTKRKKPSSATVMKQFNNLPEDIQNTIHQLIKQSGSQEDFVRSLMVGDCPCCGSTKTRDCDETPLGDITIGICLDCYRLWCLECGHLIPEGETICKHWTICDGCSFLDEKKEECGISAIECSIVQENIIKLNNPETVPKAN